MLRDELTDLLVERRQLRHQLEAATHSAAVLARAPRRHPADGDGVGAPAPSVASTAASGSSAAATTSVPSPKRVRLVAPTAAAGSAEPTSSTAAAPSAPVDDPPASTALATAPSSASLLSPGGDGLSGSLPNGAVRVRSYGELFQPRLQSPAPDQLPRLPSASPRQPVGPATAVVAAAALPSSSTTAAASATATAIRALPWARWWTVPPISEVSGAPPLMPAPGTEPNRDAEAFVRAIAQPAAGSSVEAAWRRLANRAGLSAAELALVHAVTTAVVRPPIVGNVSREVSGRIVFAPLPPPPPSPRPLGGFGRQASEGPAAMADRRCTADGRWV